MKTLIFSTLILLTGISALLSIDKSTCSALREYSIDVVSDVMDESLKWQKDFNKNLISIEPYPMDIEKTIMLSPPNNEVILYLLRNNIYYNYVPDAKYIVLKYENDNFFIRRSSNKNFRKVSEDFSEKYHSYVIRLRKNSTSGIVIISNEKAEKRLSVNFHLLSARYAYLCKINVEHPFKVVDIHIPESLLAKAYIVGDVLFNYSGNYYRLNIFKDSRNNLFTYYYEDNFDVPKYVPIKRRRGSYYILDFNKSFYHFCIYNSELSCPDKTMKTYSTSLPISAGVKR